jgi:hypothetical protein
MMSSWKCRFIIFFFVFFIQSALSLSFNEPILIDDQMPNSFIIVYADLNGDLLKDIIVTQSVESQFFWFERKPGLKPVYFRHHIIIPQEYGEHISLCDLDNDGDMDIVSSGIDDNKQCLLWRANDGETYPSFTTHIIDDNHYYARKNLVVDFDGDGDMDIISSTDYKDKLSPATIRLYVNNGANHPQFSKNILYQVANKDAEIRDFEVVDFDGDGSLDIIAADCPIRSVDWASEILWFRNLGTANPSFNISKLYDYPTPTNDIEIADLDLDGDFDIVTAFYIGEIVWLKNQLPSNPVIVPHVLAESEGDDHGGPFKIIISDPDLDRDSDIFVLYSNTDHILFLENDGLPSPSFTAELFDEPYRPAFMISDDLDYDGDPDLITLNRGTTNLFWYENKQIDDSNLIEISPLVGGESSGREGGPFDPNKFQYTITNHSLTQTLECQITTDANWLSITPSEGNVPPDSTITVDVVFNEIAETLISGNYTAQIEFRQVGLDKPITSMVVNLHIISKYFNNILPPRSIFGTSTYTYNFQITDLNRNGFKEIISTPWLSSYFYWSEQTPGLSLKFNNKGIVLSNPSPPQQTDDEFSLGDLDGDGDIDILTYSERDNYLLEWHENDGCNPPGFISHTVTPVFLYGRDNLISDLDNDGDNDIVASSAYNLYGQVPSIYWYENNGNSPPVFTQHLLTSSIGMDQVGEMIANDFDGDGDIDLVVRSDEPWQISWLENMGTKPLTFQLHIFPSEDGYYPTGMTVKDFNDDGLSEIVVSYTNNLEFGAGKIIKYENHLKSTLPRWVPVIIDESIISPDQMDIADLDMDGDLDLFVLSWFRNEDKIYYIEQLGQSTNKFEAVLFEEIYRPRYIRVDDIDQDGDQDIILQRLNDLCIYENIDDPIRLISLGGENWFDNEAIVSLEWKTNVSIAGTEIEAVLLQNNKFVRSLGKISSSEGRGTYKFLLPDVSSGKNYSIRIYSTKNRNIFDESDPFQIGG